MCESPTVLSIPLADGVLWPCTLRLSPRSKKVKLSVSAQGFTELILPQKRTFSPQELQNFLHTNTPWLQKTLDALVPRASQAERAELCLQKIRQELTPDILPAHVHFPMLGHTWQLSLQAKRGGYAKLQEVGTAQKNLVLYANAADMRACCRLLQKWLIKKATPLLQENTFALAQKMGVEVAQVRIAAQRGRWGSCSVRGNINLNCRLLLLPQYLVEHVILHELCHRVHMNHSKAFKALLESVSPQSKAKDTALRTAWQNLPLWSLIL